jgi:Niemann-Pick C1 protein
VDETNEDEIENDDEDRIATTEEDMDIDIDWLKAQKSYLHKFFKSVYAPLLFNEFVRASVILLFVAFFFSCIAMCDKLKVGLDQRLAMPSDSYQIRYFEALQKHLQVGPPVYFVVKDGYDYTSLDGVRKLCGGSQCLSDSLQSLISAAANTPNETYIGQASVNWLDDYLEWLAADPTSMTCCFAYANTTEWCDYKHVASVHADEHDEAETARKSKKKAPSCEPCRVEKRNYGMPSERALLDHLAGFLRQNPSRDCIKAGHAMYGDAVRFRTSKIGEHQRKATFGNSNKHAAQQRHSSQHHQFQINHIGRKFLFQLVFKVFVNVYPPMIKK